MKENNIPKHWQIKKLGEVCKLKNGYAFKSGNYESNGVPVIRISDINGGFVSSKNAVRVIPKNDYEDYQVEENDILVAMSGATTGKFGIYKSSEKAYQNQRVGKFKILDERILNNNFLFHQINSLKRQIEKDAYGGAQPNISSSKIEQMQIVVPPLPEQQTIVAKIEELFSELENGKQQLLTAQQQLKVYRQSLLKWAFEGKLTNHNVKEGELPEGWKIETLGNITHKIVDGTHHTPKYTESGVPFVSVKDIRNYKIDFSDTKFIDKLQHIDLIKRCNPEMGDILITKSGTIGRLAIVPNHEFSLFVSVALLKINKDIIQSKYALYAIQNHVNHLDVSSQIKGGVVKNYHLEDLRIAKIILAPFEKQNEIVSELESKLTVCDKIEKTIEECLQQTETLKQSILKKAFEGRLI